MIVSATDDLVLLRNDGAANFAPPVTILGPGRSSSSFGDFNGDNRTDIVVPLGTPGYAVLLADATGGFLPPVVHSVDGGAHLVGPADLNGDSHLDLLIISEATNRREPAASVAFGDGAGGFGAAVEVVSDELRVFADADRRERRRARDLVAISSRGTFAVWLGNGAGASRRRSTSRTPCTTARGGRFERGWPAGHRDRRPQRQAQRLLQQLRRRAANLSVAVSESADPVNEGDELTYTVTVTNQTGTGRPACG